MDYRRSARQSRSSSGQSRYKNTRAMPGEGSGYAKTLNSERQREVPQGRSGYNRTRDYNISSTKGRSGYN
ncbi:hypothetical protein LX32DRAFT_5548 [Colletotrichum zoysiae]|uniref:Uncharacterized protein n=1 Tax=Colletotrichum zoysiae TaxID=1216348 RepID=A0AAD9HT20_9PEZI|nr:hypothetical protein LX32DRAFT_5548 [Colletotrichum zoysiae]